MTANRIGWALALLALAGCDDRIGDYPDLLPTDQILAEPNVPAHAADAATDPTAATDALKSRAARISGTAPAPVAADPALSRRADALRARAAELANTPLDACPEGAAPCADPDTPPASDQKE
ncbi:MULTISPECIES: hypothetical protein [Paracoccus]|jgi:hypothetical protein|uniref:Uncharacterized protein n=1 Tax=Paracoccus litorisediminis TaxID=2006130 RepID=A0A844HIU6_9RHOB|nr:MULTISPECIES: hypothetical protein [Paracoccus]MBD9525289.1 hypothetical protein [Paracoccus sp. PAR01]MTH57721.1 hypothetical protein [Paracoccus litorisediminis]